MKLAIVGAGIGGRFAGYQHPRFSIHRGDLHAVLLSAVTGRLGPGRLNLDHICTLRNALTSTTDPATALRKYEAARLPVTANVVRTNRTTPPDAILREVWLRTGDRPFTRIEDVIDISEPRAISERYKDIAGFSHQALEAL